MTISERGLDFVVRHEGFVSRAYRDVGGVWTIGTGFTNRSRVAVEMLGPIGAGKTITRATSARVLTEAFAREYGPPVDAAMPGSKQHERDAGYSYCFNCGPGAMSDRWVGLWRDGFTFEAGERLKRTRITAGGTRVQGLVNRRKAEARLLVAGDYGTGSPANDDADGIREKLAALGYDSVLAFQHHHPNLINDGILGPATRAQIERDLAARREGVGVGVGGVLLVIGSLAAWVLANSLVLGIAAGLTIATLVAWFAVRRREELVHWINNRTG
jgi:lysozyme